jgi:hypothetical protein
VDEPAVHDVVAVDLGVDGGNLLQRRDAGAAEERHEAEADAVLLLEAVLVLRPERHDGAAVDLVERREDGGGVLRGDESLGDALADAAHRHALLASVTRRARRRTRDRRARGHAGRHRGRRLPHLRERVAAFEVRQDVALGEPPALARCGDRARIEPVLVDQVAHRGAERTDRAAGDGRRRGPGITCRWRRRDGRRGRASRRRGWSARGRGRPCVLLDARHHVPLGDGLALLLQDVQHAGALGR